LKFNNEDKFNNLFKKLSFGAQQTIKKLISGGDMESSSRDVDTQIVIGSSPSKKMVSYDSHQKPSTPRIKASPMLDSPQRMTSSHVNLKIVPQEIEFDIKKPKSFSMGIFPSDSIENANDSDWKV
jgi:hypothetical protein